MRKGPKERGADAQAQARQLEREVRVVVVAFVRWAMLLYKLTASQAASRLALPVRTVASWLWSWRQDHLKSHALGRPAGDLTADQQELLASLLFLMGPRTGVEVLQPWFPRVPRAAIQAYVARYRARLDKGAHVRSPELEWRNCGAVWAMDYTKPPAPVDALYPQVLAVRDLGSHTALAALPVGSATAAATVALLESLFVEYGPPLVIKCDNGSNLKCDEVRRLLHAHGVVLLPSPPETPRYNGACEAGIGSLKTRAHHLAASHGRPGEWTCDDVEGARLMANETSRPYGALGPTPDEQWRYRQRHPADFRVAFRKTVDYHTEGVYRQKGWLPGLPLKQADRDEMDRIAITTALLDMRILIRHRRGFTPGILRENSANITG